MLWSDVKRAIKGCKQGCGSTVDAWSAKASRMFLGKGCRELTWAGGYEARVCVPVKEASCKPLRGNKRRSKSKYAQTSIFRARSGDEI